MLLNTEEDSSMLACRFSASSALFVTTLNERSRQSRPHDGFFLLRIPGILPSEAPLYFSSRQMPDPQEQQPHSD